MNHIKKIPQPIEGFSAVKMMREIREKLSERYWQHSDILKKDMEVMRKKYNIKTKKD